MLCCLTSMYGVFWTGATFEKNLFKSAHHRKRLMQLKSVVQININLKDFLQYFSTFASLKVLNKDFSLLWWYHLVEYRCFRRFSSHLKTWYFRNFSRRIWPLPGANFAKGNFVKDKDSRQAKCIFTRPRANAGGRVLNPARFVCFYFLLFGVTNRHSWDADARAVSEHVLLLLKSLFSGIINGELYAQNYGFGLRGRSVPPHVR